MTDQAKSKYTIRNWGEYNRGLVQRGSLTIWFSPEALDKWKASKNGKRGRPCICSDEAILCMLMLKAVYHLPFRQLRGLLESLVMLLGLSIPLPCYTRICRRARLLGQKIERVSRKRPVDIVFDSTGLKVYGEGEWHVKKHGVSKRRDWRKVHLAVCPKSHEIILSLVTRSNVGDSTAFCEMKDALPRSVKRGYADGAYDTTDCYCGFFALGIEPILPPQKNGVVDEDVMHLESRNNAIKEIKGLGGDEDARRLWKKLKGYHRRSLAETAMFRFKKLFGSGLSCRNLECQRAEVFSKCLVINKMNSLGMPKGKWVYS